MSTSVDPAFKHLSRHQTCFLIWRIENFQPVPVPVDQYGTFYDGDSYIVLSVSMSVEPGSSQRAVYERVSSGLLGVQRTVGMKNVPILLRGCCRAQTSKWDPELWPKLRSCSLLDDKGHKCPPWPLVKQLSPWNCSPF